MLCPLAARNRGDDLSVDLFCSARHGIARGDGVVLTIFFEPPQGCPNSITSYGTTTAANQEEAI
jgi:hypothetical protein